MSADFNIELVQKYLSTEKIGQRMIYQKSIDSTNAEAKLLVEEGGEEGTVVVAGEQTSGRGRLKRSWQSPPGGLWFSIILKPKGLDPEKLGLISLMAGVSAAEAVKEMLKLEVGLKWPNDIMINNKKAAGILSELASIDDEIINIVVGIGLNVNNKTSNLDEEFRASATSIADEIGENEEISLEELLTNILNKFESNYFLILDGKEKDLLTKWRSFSTTLGMKVMIKTDSAGEISGTAVDIDEKGAIILKDGKEEMETIVAGDCIHLTEE